MTSNEKPTDPDSLAIQMAAEWHSELKAQTAKYFGLDKSGRYNTRIAPSPTGDFHIGSARTAYFNWLAARATGGKFILRIDDTDQKRNDPAFTQVILDAMAWLGLDYDEIVYQSARFEEYRSYANDLLKRGWAEEKDGAIVLKLQVSEGSRLKAWHDEIIGNVSITDDDYSHTDGMVLIKSDGSPSYNFCSVIDDLHFGINYVIRGVDHITNTSKQVLLNNIVAPDTGDDWEPKFAHVGLICIGGKPLSKRDGAASLLGYMKAGYDPDAMLNFLARLGWGPTVDDKSTAILPREKMLEIFLKGGKMKNQSANYDAAKLESFDRKYKARKGVWRTKEKLS